MAQNDLGETIGNEPDQNGAAQILNHEIAQLDDPSAQKSAAPLLDASFAGPQAGEPIPSDPIQQGGYMGDPTPPIPSSRPSKRPSSVAATPSKRP